MGNQKTILFIIASLQGGAASHLLTLARGLRERGWRLILAAPEDSVSHTSSAREIFHSWERIPLDESCHRRNLEFLHHAIIRTGPTLLHAHGTRAAFYARLWNLLRASRRPARFEPPRLPIVYTVHGFHPAFYRNTLRKWAVLLGERLLNRLVRRVIAVSASDADLMRQYHAIPEERLTVIPNAIDPEPFRNLPGRDTARADLQINPGAFVVGTASRLRFQKPVHTLIDAAEIAARSISDLRVMIAGDGPLRSQLEARVREKNLAEVVRFLGEVQDMPAFYASLDLFCLTSLWEGLPLAILEAAAAGVPIVAANVPGTKDILSSPGAAVLVEPENPLALSLAVVDLYGSPHRRLATARAAEDLLAVYHNPDAMCTRTETVYQELIEDSSP